MSQPSLFQDAPVTRSRKSGQVPASSVAAYRQRANPDCRLSVVMSWLQQFVEDYGRYPTSAELADWADGALGFVSPEAHLLYCRRGLSDLKAKNLIEHSAKRQCEIAGTLAVTWKVRTR